MTARIADLGEGKMLNRASKRGAPSFRSFGGTLTRAPEVHNYSDYTPEADVFDFGRVWEEVVLLQWEKAESRHGDRASRKIPRWLFQIIQGCLQKDPRDRPRPKKIALDVDRHLSAHLRREENENFELVDPDTLQDDAGSQQEDTSLDIPRQ